jgi:hypothetical protein
MDSFQLFVTSLVILQAAGDSRRPTQERYARPRESFSPAHRGQGLEPRRLLGKQPFRAQPWLDTSASTCGTGHRSTSAPVDAIAASTSTHRPGTRRSGPALRGNSRLRFPRRPGCTSKTHSGRSRPLILMLGDATRLRVFGHSVSEAAPTNVRGLREMSRVIATKLPWANQEWVAAVAAIIFA